jgi:hypothetical protein
MPLIIEHHIDGQVTELRILFSASGTGISIKYIETEKQVSKHDGTGTVIRTSGEIEEPMASGDCSARERDELVRIATKIAQNWRRRRYGALGAGG